MDRNAAYSLYLSDPWDLANAVWIFQRNEVLEWGGWSLMPWGVTLGLALSLSAQRHKKFNSNMILYPSTVRWQNRGKNLQTVSAARQSVTEISIPTPFAN